MHSAFASCEWSGFGKYLEPGEPSTPASDFDFGRGSPQETEGRKGYARVKGCPVVLVFAWGGRLSSPPASAGMAGSCCPATQKADCEVRARTEHKVLCKTSEFRSLFAKLLGYSSSG